MFDEKNNPEEFVDLEDYFDSDDEKRPSEDQVQETSDDFQEEVIDNHVDSDDVVFDDEAIDEPDLLEPEVHVPEVIMPEGFEPEQEERDIGIPEEMKAKAETVQEAKKDKSRKPFKLKSPTKKDKGPKGEKLNLGIHSLKTQVIIMLTLAVLVPILIIMFVIFTQVSKSNQNDIEDSASIFVYQANDMINEKIKSYMSGLPQVLKDLDEAPAKYGELGDNYRQVLTRYKRSSDYIYEAYVITENNFKHSSSGVSLPMSEDLKTQEWLIEARDKTLTIWEPVEESDRMVYRVTKKIKNGDEDALFVLELNLTDILAFASNISVLDEGYAMVASREGMILYHQNPDLIGTYLPQDLYDEMDIRKEYINKALLDEELTIEIGFNEYQWDAESNGKRVLTYLQNRDNDWVVMTTFEISEITGKIYPLFLTIIMVVVGVLVVMMIVGIQFANRITKPISQLIGIMKKVEAGDLSVAFETRSRTEVKILGDSFNVMVEHLRNIISNMKNTFSSVEDFAQTLELAVEQTTIASNEISKSMISVAEGAETQAENTNDSVKMINDMDTKILAVNNSAVEIKTSSGGAIELSAQGMERVNDLKEISELNLEKAQHVIEEMDTLTGRVGKISDIISLINDISRQTNLLALNASIEAARAGEHGRGFAVVANEVSKLAEQTSQAVHGIGDLLSEILSDADKASKAVDTMQDIASKQNVQVDASMRIFNDISEWINDIVVKVHNIENDLQAAVESKDVVATSINTISDLAQDSSAVSEEVSAATEEQLASLEQLDTNTRELNEMVKRVSADIDSQFKF